MLLSNFFVVPQIERGQQVQYSIDCVHHGQRVPKRLK
jgi:hypothetical protein